MKARDVIQFQRTMADTRDIVTRLFAVTPPGEGVYIAPDGTLMEVVPCGGNGVARLYRLVPIEEATDD